MKDHSSPFLEADLIRFFNSLAETEAGLRDAAEPRYVLEVGLVKLAEMRRVKPIEDLLKRISELEDGNRPRPAERASGAGESDKTPEKKTPGSEDGPEKADTEKRDVVRSIAAIPENAAEPEGLSPEDTAAPVNETVEPPAENETGAFRIDPDSMPVKLPPISSDELEHVEDPWLDSAYERMLAKEGDDLQTIPEAAVLAGQVIGHVAEEDPETIARSAAAERDRPATNRAMEIAEEMSQPAEIDAQLPELPPDPTEEELLEYAEQHPLVRKAKRLFRGEIVSVTKD